MASQADAWKSKLQERLNKEVVVQCLIDVPSNETIIRILSADAVYIGNVFVLEYRSRPLKADLDFRGGELFYKSPKWDGERVEIKRNPQCAPGSPFIICRDPFLGIMGLSLPLSEIGRQKGFEPQSIAVDYAYRALLGSQSHISLNSPELMAHYGRLQERIYCELVMAPKPEADSYEWSVKMENLVRIHRRFGAFGRRRQNSWAQMW